MMKELNEYTNEELIDEIRRRMLEGKKQKALGQIELKSDTTVEQRIITGKKQYDCVCTKCGTATKVPFLPKEGYPIKCLKCYRSEN